MILNRPARDDSLFVEDAFSSFNRHHGRGQKRDQLLLALTFSKDFGLNQRKGAAWFYHARTRNDALADRRRDQVDFELRGQNSGTRRHQAERSVTRRRVCNALTAPA
jgi:hypothetical protein